MRVLRGLAVAVVTVLTVSGCSWFADGPQEITERFLAALASGDTAAAAALTDSPESAKAAFDQARAALEPEKIDHAVEHVGQSSPAVARYRLEWRLPGGRTWAYAAEAELYSADDTWKVRWQPSVVHPELAMRQQLALRVDTPRQAPVLDRDGQPLLEPQTVVAVLLDPAHAATAAKPLAEALKPIDASLTEQSIVEGAKAAQRAYSVVTLRQSDYLAVKPAIYELPGLRFSEQRRLLPVDPSLAEQLWPSIRSTVEAQVAGNAGWRVLTTDTGGGEVAELHAQEAKPADAVTTTLSRRTQAAGERAIEAVPGAAMIVAMRPSTGELLAVAQNAPADQQGPIALTGRYPPGSTFKIVTAAAGLSAGKVTAASPVDCPATMVVDGRLIPNNDRFALGTVPLSRAFAESCNTTFATLSTDLPAMALTDSARDLGLGADFVVPGLTTITGSVPPAGSIVQQAENGFGQGTVLASPFGMTVVAATVASGRIPVPSLLRGGVTEAKNLGAPVRPDVLEALRGMMREVVTGTALRDLPDVRGKTGTAQFGDGSDAHGWFVGYSGDLAFAVLLTGAGSSGLAVEAAHRFLTALG
ncbi:penicillin-binding transpeptidase domain-containing protein [Amycolatopsis magusensis]|uniref:Cell division protein FtsI/penicillin-binding protein 2 n=1 Tax=Amycolatopsis magusensis TaxID=882444 RepID=A0ABS4Q3Z1_9PSEU|nr:penicillin-binding transpeptidase domain-containing protein [Amycolatopsis magusensis]MBP2186392.1 cell division protein FtsI/penicillin-binding protein 2 [Amycolatopsis magusensis]